MEVFDSFAKTVKVYDNFLNFEYLEKVTNVHYESSMHRLNIDPPTCSHTEHEGLQHHPASTSTSSRKMGQCAWWIQ